MVTSMRTLAVALAAVAVLVPAQALAHAQLVRAEPRVGSAVPIPPARLWLKFTEVPRLAASGVQLTFPDGRAKVLQPLTQDPKDVRAVNAPLPPLGPGRYRVLWKVLSPDGHRTQGGFAFTVGGR